MRQNFSLTDQRLFSSKMFLIDAIKYLRHRGNSKYAVV